MSGIARRQREEERLIVVPVGSVDLEASGTVPAGAVGLVLLVHPNASGRRSSRNRRVARALEEASLATLLVDLLTPEEDELDRLSADLRSDLPFLADRLAAVTDWLGEAADYRRLHLGYFGGSTGAAVALLAACQRPDRVHAIVSRGGRPDLVEPHLGRVRAPTLLVAGSRDLPVLEANRAAYAELRCDKRLEIVAGATQLFDEPGALEEVGRLAAGWFDLHLVAAHRAERAPARQSA